MGNFKKVPLILGSPKPKPYTSRYALYIPYETFKGSPNFGKPYPQTLKP